MNTQEYINKITILAQEISNLNEKYQIEIRNVGPLWLRDVPLSQFIELCDTFNHDPVKLGGWPTTWLEVGGINIMLWGVDKIPAQPVPPAPSTLDYLRTFI